MIYKRVLGGASEDLPRRFFFDARDDVVLLGTTWSSNFPVTPDAVQSAYAGPPLVISTGPPPSGGDLFLSVLNPAGDLLYSTFLGSSCFDDILGIQAAPHMRVEVLVTAGADNFPVAPADAEQPSSGLVLLTIDLNRWSNVRSAYLPVGPQGKYFASFGDHGSETVTTSGGLYTFSRDGRLRTFVSLDPGKVLYAGPAPGTVGQAAIKVQLPPSQPSFFSTDFPTLTVGSITMLLSPGIIVQ